jgi:hypothetical protein
MKLKKFAEKEKLKDHLLYMIKQDKMNRIDKEVVEPSSDIIMNIMEVQAEIYDEEGEDAAASYIFNVLANYVLLSQQLLDMNEYLIEKLDREDEYL